MILPFGVKVSFNSILFPPEVSTIWMRHSLFIHSAPDGHLVWFHCVVLIAVQSLSCVQLCNPIDCNTPGFPVLHYPPEFAQTQVCGVGDAIQSSHPLSSPSPPSIRVFSNESVLCIRWPNYWSFNFSISPYSEHSLEVFFNFVFTNLL